MDPNACYREMIKLASSIQDRADAGEEVSQEDTDSLAELVLALDGWLRGGGFLPFAWSRTRARQVVGTIRGRTVTVAVLPRTRDRRVARSARHAREKT